jgi:hypothetical protein
MQTPNNLCKEDEVPSEVTYRLGVPGMAQEDASLNFSPQQSALLLLQQLVGGVL